MTKGPTKRRAAAEAARQDQMDETDQAAAKRQKKTVYAVPALERGLDVIELLSSQKQGLTGSQIAAQLGRSPGGVFRILSCLERRRIIERLQPGERFALTPRLLGLSLAHPPVDQLLTTAIPAMQEMAEQMYLSCHLGIYNAGKLLVVAQVPSPASIGFQSRRGAQFHIAHSISGRTLLAFRTPTERAMWLRAAHEDPSTPPAPDDLEDRLEQIRRDGYELSSSPVWSDVVDASAPIFDDSCNAIAALAVPFVATTETRVSLTDPPRLPCETTRNISTDLGTSFGSRTESGAPRSRSRLQ